MEKIDNLDHLLRASWNMLFRGAVQRRHPFHTFVLASTNREVPSARTVVLRETQVDKRRILIYTDVRTQKVEDIKKHPIVSLVFWDKQKQVQLRTTGKAILHHQDELTRQKWNNISNQQRKDYATVQPPGTEQQKAENDLPAYWSLENRSPKESDHVYENFAILAIEITAIDFLQLDREGHRRAKFTWEEGGWQKSWLVP